METLIGLALKSLLIAGLTLLILHATRRRSAAERSLIAHLGLVALVALPLASLALPSLRVELPAALVPAREAVVPVQGAPDIADVTAADLIGNATTKAAVAEPSAAAIDWTPYAYAVPAVALLLVTLVALLRLFALRSRAQVLVDPAWLSALAHAQRRMGFKHGTALLTSNELSSPISWGLMRPVILLNDEALEARGEAEAIIAHELAHVARLDWAKLMLARVATAVFWFNPLAWVLAREAHQLREEAADDAVLAANIDETDYAQLLVGVARHECKGFLLGAHGVAPGKGSLRRRVGRVLDGTLARSPATKSWIAGFGAGMLVMSAPLAALTFAPKAEDKLTAEDVARAEAPNETAYSSDLPVVAPALPQGVIENPEGGTIETRRDGVTVMRSPTGATITLFAPDAAGKRKVVMKGPSGATMTYADASKVPGLENFPFGTPRRKAGQSDGDGIVAMKAVGVTPEYLASIRAAAPHLGALDSDDAIELRAAGVTADYIRELSAAGFRNVDKDTLVEARSVGVNGKYIRSMAEVGIRGSIDDFVEMRALGIGARDARNAKAAAAGGITARKLLQMTEGDEDPDPPEPPNVNPDE